MSRDLVRCSFAQGPTTTFERGTDDDDDNDVTRWLKTFKITTEDLPYDAC